MPEMPEIKSWLDGRLIQLPISMAPPLRLINSYLLRDPRSGELTIVDPGPRSVTTENEWSLIQEQLEIDPQRIKQIVVTHHHPDHFGLAGYLQQKFGVPVRMSRTAHLEALRMWRPDRAMSRALPELFRAHGFPERLAEELPDHLESFYLQVDPMPEVTYVEENQELEMGGWLWLPVETGGHASGHLSFFQPEQRIILCGDAVLPQISPSISYNPGGDSQPLHTFLEGLRKLGQYEAVLAFPGHRHPFDYFNTRLEVLIEHHEERLAKVSELLRPGPQTGFGICAALFGTKLSLHQMRFAMSEALAHLMELVRRDEARVELQPDGGYLFVDRKFANTF